jgi:TetR/AcrR family transcriptional regulator, mexCD-oprJ operon repressor
MTGAPSTDHRRAVAERNATAILDAAERLLEHTSQLSMSAIAAEAGVSRPTLYAHFKTISDIVEAAVDRSVVASIAAFEAARPESGTPEEALRRMVLASWSQLGKFDALARGALEYVTRGAVLRTHEPLMETVRRLVDRGRAEGAFRTDMPADWLVSMFFTIMHGAYEHAGASGADPGEARELATRTIGELFGGR